MFPTARPRSTSRIAATSSPTASTRSARCGMAGSSTSGGISTGWRVRSPNCGSVRRCRARRSGSCCARRCGATGSGTASSICRSRAGSRVDIKSVSLLPNVLAKEAAHAAGAKEAWFVDADGFVTEGSSTNAWIVTRDGKILTRPADHGILRGITRTVLLDVIAAQNLTLEEGAFTVEEAYAAREAFVTSATQIVMPVVRIDGRPVGNGAPGLVASALRRDFHRHAELG